VATYKLSPPEHDKSHLPAPLIAQPPIQFCEQAAKHRNFVNHRQTRDKMADQNGRLIIIDVGYVQFMTSSVRAAHVLLPLIIVSVKPIEYL
jgi:hypothetical protein